MLHIITPFSRIENKEFYLLNFEDKSVVWHPIISSNNIFDSDQNDWIKPCLCTISLDERTPNITKLNFFIKNYLIVNEDYYLILNDDDYMEENLPNKINNYTDDILFISMKRGDEITSNNKYNHGTTTLYPFKGVGRGSIGFEQIIVKGRILKQMNFLYNLMSDGYMAEWLQENFDVKYITDIYSYFNYLELGRWLNKKELKNMETIAQRFERVKNEHRDISQHLDTLYKYAQECEDIVELGVNEGISTTAFLMAKKKFYNFDVHLTKMFDELIEMAKIENVEMNFTIANDLKIEIPECDLLFIDTLHTYTQLKAELKLHSDKARKYIIMHDTEVFGKKGVDGSVPGMWLAVEEFLKENSKWEIKEHYTYCNGLTVLERKEPLLKNDNEKIIRKNKKYLLATSGFLNPDLLKICIKSWPSSSKDLEKIVFFDGTKWRTIFSSILENNEILKWVNGHTTTNSHIGVSGGWNKILEYAFEKNDFENVIIVGSDIEMTNNFFDELIIEYESSKADLFLCNGFNCFIISKKCYDLAGKFDENFFPAYFEDNDYDHRVKKTKELIYRNVGHKDKLKHFGSAVIRLNDDCNSANGQTFTMNRNYYNKKWGGNPTEEKFEYPYNNSELTLKDWILDKEIHQKKIRIWNK